MSILNQFGRLNKLLIVLLLVQFALGAIIFWPRTAASEAGGPLLAGVKAEDVAALVIRAGDGSQLAMARQDDTWILPEAGDYPANEESVAALLEKIEALQTNRLVTRTEASHERLQVGEDDFNRRLELTLTDGSSHKLLVGSSAGASATHVRAGDQPEVYLTGELTPWEINAQPSGWIDTLYFTLPQNATTALTLENANGTVEFTRSGDSWRLADLASDESLNPSAVTAWLGQVSSIQMVEPIGTEAPAASGLENPLARLILQTENETYLLKVGRQDSADGSYVFSASNSPYFVRVAQFTGDHLVNKSRDDFLVAPPAPETDESDTPTSSQ